MGEFKGGDDNINRNGRPAGSKNKSTKHIREAYQKLTEDNLTNMSIWIAQIAAEDPAKAMDTMIKLSEYILPKLQRTEMTGNDGEDLFKNIKFEFGPDVNDADNRDIPNIEDYV
tara:strand:+ start:234 stop:575 length:342 start_codon:yes stop_codon:yes gene_type:complete